MGPEADVMLSMNESNCNKYEMGIMSMLQDADRQLDEALNANYKDIWTEMQNADPKITGPELCNYLDWAYYARVSLQGNMD